MTGPGRRGVLAAPLLLALLPRAAPGLDELRVGGAAPEAWARRIAARTGLRTVPRRLSGAALVEALDRGHLEAAMLTPAEFRAAEARMGDRLLPLRADGGLVTRRVLPAGLFERQAAGLFGRQAG